MSPTLSSSMLLSPALMLICDTFYPCSASQSPHFIYNLQIRPHNVLALPCNLRALSISQCAGPTSQSASSASQSTGPALQSTGPVLQSTGPVLQSTGPVLQPATSASQLADSALQPAVSASQSTGAASKPCDSQGAEDCLTQCPTAKEPGTNNVCEFICDQASSDKFLSEGSCHAACPAATQTAENNSCEFICDQNGRHCIARSHPGVILENDVFQTYSSLLSVWVCLLSLVLRHIPMLIP